MVKDFNPSLDAGLGLVYRMNNHWAEADRCSIEGRYGDWESVLDVIWRNLSYRNPMEEVKDDDGNIIDIKLSKKDISNWKLLNENINIAKINCIKAKKFKPKSFNKYRANLYRALQLKDVYLRKKMFELKLYLKETSRDTGGATFGSFGR